MIDQRLVGVFTLNKEKLHTNKQNVNYKKKKKKKSERERERERERCQKEEKRAIEGDHIAVDRTVQPKTIQIGTK